MLRAPIFAGSLPLLGQGRTALRAKVPFPCEVSNQAMAAGVYTFYFPDSRGMPEVCLREGKNMLRGAAVTQP